MGIPDEPFWAPAELVAAYRERRRRARRRGARARGRRASTRLDVDERAAWDAAGAAPASTGWDDDLPTFEQGEKIATREAIAEGARRHASTPFPGWSSGAADLTGNTGTKLDRPDRAVAPRTPAAARSTTASASTRMGSAMVGMATPRRRPAGRRHVLRVPRLHAPAGAAGRAVAGPRSCFVFTHDSVGVGEDGPTHQPVEHLATLRAIPGLQVIRPADANETVAALARRRRATTGPTALVLTRQDIPVVHRRLGRRARRRHRRATPTTPAVVLVGTGSEVAVCVDAAEQLADDGHRHPGRQPAEWDRFAAPGRRRTATSVLPAGVPVLSVEAATTFGWERCADDSIGIDRFGASAPGAVVLDKLGINVDHVVERATRARRRPTTTVKEPPWSA